MNKTRVFVFCLTVSLAGAAGWAGGLPKSSSQVLIKALQDPNAEVRLAAAQALAQFEDEYAIKALETALIAASESGEQDALVKALLLNKDSSSVRRLTEALNNPQFTWGKGAKPRAVEVIAKIGGKKTIKWLTDLVASEQEPAVRAAAARMLGELGAPPKKD